MRPPRALPARRLGRLGANAVFCASLLLAVASVCGCQRVEKIKVSPERPLMSSRTEGLQLKAVALDKDGKELPDVRVIFKTMTPTMATVDGQGKVTAVQSGDATILMRAGRISRSVNIQIQIPKKIVIKPFVRNLMLGVRKQYKATVIDDRDQPMITGEGVKWSTSDPETITVDKYGNIKTVKEGRASITAFAAGIKGVAEITVKHEELDKEGVLDTRER